MKRYSLLALIIIPLLAIALTACSDRAAPTSTPSPSPEPSPTLTQPPPTPTATPSPTPEPPTPTPTATPRPTSTPTPTPEPVDGRTGGRLTTLALANVPNLDVHREVQETLTSLGPGIAYSRLLRLRTGPADEVPQPSLRLECDLCQSWRVVDPFTYVFQLRDGVRWHDRDPVDGRELTADDIVYSYERQRTPGWPNSALLQGIDTIEAEGPDALRLTLEPQFPSADLLVALADGHSKIVAQEVVDKWDGLEHAPVIGTGPWQWESTREDVGSVFSKNTDYFEDGLPLLDELVIRIIRGEERTRLAVFLTGGVDMYRISPSGWLQLSETPNAAVESFFSRQGGAGVVLTMNASRPPFDDVQVRRAVFRALDPWNYVRTIWGGQGFPSLGMPVSEPGWNLSVEEMREPYFANPTDASRILDASGAVLPIRFELSLADFGDLHQALGTEVEEDLRSVGFEPRTVALNSSLYEDKVWRDKDYDLALGELPPISTPNGFLFGILHSSLGNVVGHSDAELDSLIVRQSVEDDPAARQSLVRELQQRVLEQAYMTMPVTTGARWVFHPHVEGFFPNVSASEYFYWAKAWRNEGS